MLKRSRKRLIITLYVMKLKLKLTSLPVLLTFILFQACIFVAIFEFKSKPQNKYPFSQQKQDLYEKDSMELQTALNAIRYIFLNLNNNQAQKVKNNTNINSDFLFDSNFYVNLSDKNHLDNLRSKSFYEPNLIIKNSRNSCENIQSNETTLLLLVLIHSDRNNFRRRNTLRNTWLSLNKFNVSIDLNLVEKPLQIVHMFIVGSSFNQNEMIENEARKYNDILMIDTLDTYHNLLYKHLTVVNWAIQYCSNAAYVIKLDDDVYVNIKPLAKHLINKFGVVNSNDSEKFIYCNNINLASPIRNTSSKWFVNVHEYPFKYYPRYCEGFSYITNVATFRLIKEQSKLIPRFWIDDIYVTGLLLNGLDQVKRYDYLENAIQWSYYDYWDLNLNKSHFDLIDFYKMDHFIILHQHLSYANRFIATQDLNLKYLNLIQNSTLNNNKQNWKKFSIRKKIDFYFNEFCFKMFNAAFY